MRSPRALFLVSVLVSACGGRDEALAPEAPDAAPPDDAGSCEPGATASAEIGAAGGEVTLCGARLAVAPDVLAEDATFTIELVEAPGDVPFGLRLAGEAFAFSSTIEPLPGLVSIDVPRDDDEGYLHLFVHDGAAWQGLEACRVDEGVIGQDVGVLGTYAAMRDVEVYPPSPDGLGEGTIDAVLDGTEYPFTLDEASRGIYQEGEDGSRVVTLYLWYTPPAGELHVLDLRLVVPAEGDPSILQAGWIELGGGPSYSYLDGLTAGSATLTLTADGDHYSGEANVTFDDQGTEHTLVATFDVTVEAYAFPPELVCPGGGPKG